MTEFLLLFLLVVSSPESIQGNFDAAHGKSAFLGPPPMPLDKHDGLVPVCRRPNDGCFPLYPGEEVKILSRRGSWVRVIGARPFLFRGWVREEFLVHILQGYKEAYCSRNHRKSCMILPKYVPYRVLDRSGERTRIVLWGPDIPALELYVRSSDLDSSRDEGRCNYRYYGSVSSYSLLKKEDVVYANGFRVKVFTDSYVAHAGYFMRKHQLFLFHTGSRTCTVRIRVANRKPVRLRSGSYRYFSRWGRMSNYRYPKTVRNFEPVRPLRVEAPYELYLNEKSPISMISDYDHGSGKGRVWLHTVKNRYMFGSSLFRPNRMRLVLAVLLTDPAVWPASFRSRIREILLGALKTYSSNAFRKWSGWVKFDASDIAVTPLK